MSGIETRNRADELITQARRYRGTREEDWLLHMLADEVEHYQRALVAHHNLATLSDDVIREYDWRECPVCKRAREEP